MSQKITNKVLDLSQVIKDLEDKPLKWLERQGQKLDDQDDATLKHCILRLITNAGNLSTPLSDEEKQHAYEAGRIIGMAQTDEVELNPTQYNVVKKIADCNEIKIQNQLGEILTFIYITPVKMIIDSAPNMVTGDPKQDKE